MMIVNLRAESGLREYFVRIPLNDKAFAREQMLYKKIKLDERINRLDKHFKREGSDYF
jgi:hypothetical protein